MLEIKARQIDLDRILWYSSAVMLKIRMQRTGRKNDPAFRVVVAEHTVGPKSGKIVEKVGSHHPRTKETIFNTERVKHWLSVGAQASDRIHNLLIAEGIIEGEKVNVLPKKTPVVKEEAPAEEAPAAAEAQAEGEEGATDTPAEENTDSPKEDKEADETPVEETPAESGESPAEAEETKSDEVPSEDGEKKEN